MKIGSFALNSPAYWRSTWPIVCYPLNTWSLPIHHCWLWGCHRHPYFPTSNYNIGWPPSPIRSQRWTTDRHSMPSKWSTPAPNSSFYPKANAVTATWAIEWTSETIKRNLHENSKQLTVNCHRIYMELWQFRELVVGPFPRGYHCHWHIVDQTSCRRQVRGQLKQRNSEYWNFWIVYAAAPQLTTSISIERQGNCFLVNFILMDFIEYLSIFNAFDSCSGLNVSQISLNFSSTPSIENCSKKSVAPMFAHTNGTEFTVAPPTLLNPMPPFLMLHTARFDIFASVTMMAVENRVRMNCPLANVAPDEDVTHSRNPSCTLDRLKSFWISLWWLNFSYFDGAQWTAGVIARNFEMTAASGRFPFASFAHIQYKQTTNCQIAKL